MLQNGKKTCFKRDKTYHPRVVTCCCVQGRYTFLRLQGKLDESGDDQKEKQPLRPPTPPSDEEAE